MLYLEKIHLLQFKNYEDSEFSFVSGVNCITGDNGKGKTNLLDAIHYLCFSKSFLNPVDSQNIQHDAPFFVLEGFFQRDGREEQLYCALKRGQKKQLKRNKKEYDRLADHIGLFPLVVISPLDGVLVTGGSEERRRFIDSLISQFDHSYLDTLIAYNRVLQQRNALLKQIAERRSNEDDTLEVLDLQLAGLGVQVHQARTGFTSEFMEVFNRYYELVSGNQEQVSFEYISQLNDQDFVQVLKAQRDKDKRMQYTTAGVHKDDLDFKLGGFPIKRFGSQGQQKTYLAALKLAEHEFLGRKTGLQPILLLDDIFDKLDHQRVGRLIQKVSEEGVGQVFITDTGNEKISDVFRKFEVNASFVTL